MNKIKLLMEHSSELALLEKMSTQKIATILNISQERAIHLRQMYQKFVETPFLQMYKKHRITPICYTDPNYPLNLKLLYDPPAVLYTKGDISLLQNPRKLAIIGSRKATNYSKMSIEQLLPPLLEQDFVIVSGLAKGADALAHQITMNLGGRTIAVLGTGLFHVYPKENTRISDEMENSQLLVTEYPPYITPKKWNFPMRNRIISGLSVGVVITEAQEKSGTVSTMEHALENGKEIFAVPGSIFSELSTGPHSLILEGAKPVWSGYQILEELNIMHELKKL
ncbi:DNA-processing protein DprA [Psychrobacillus sp.]|uniref:DNA-processing protein DprA n=1 Tax=Psychrobacillus sp. TaxID=1871623 RepID=UPI0028BD5711|nr:DNA-processing protein DprA [Psychrobacillus sp.]